MSIRALLNKITLDDIVISVFNEAQLEKIPSGKALLHDFFYKISQWQDVPESIAEALSDESFGAGEIYPFSRELESALVRLQIAGLISSMNPDYRKYSIDDNQRSLIKELFNNFEPDEKETIKRIAKEFKNEICK